MKRTQLIQIEAGRYYFAQPHGSTIYVFEPRAAAGYIFGRGTAICGGFETWETTQENLDEMRAKMHAFARDFAAARQEQDGFSALALPTDATIYCRRLRDTRYQFILHSPGAEKTLHRECTAREFLAEFENMLLSACGIQRTELASQRSPLYLYAKVKDEYLAAEIEYFCGQFTRRTIETLNAVRPAPVFFAEKEEYAETDFGERLEITEIRRGKTTFFNRRAYYHLKICIGGEVWDAEWQPLAQELKMNCYEGKIKISAALHEKIAFLAGETKKQVEIRNLMQLNNYLYGHKFGLDKLPLEHRLKVFHQLEQVKFEDLKLLPDHDLERLTIAQLYDWLHCAGYIGDAEACAFVAELAKKRKEKHTY